MAVNAERIPISDPYRLRSLGGVGQVSRELSDYRNRVRLLEEKHDEMQKKYPDQWVALTADGTIVAAATIDEIMEKLRRKGLKGNDAAMKFMATMHRQMIL